MEKPPTRYVGEKKQVEKQMKKQMEKTLQHSRQDVVQRVRHGNVQSPKTEEGSGDIRLRKPPVIQKTPLVIRRRRRRKFLGPYCNTVGHKSIIQKPPLVVWPILKLGGGGFLIPISPDAKLQSRCFFRSIFVKFSGKSSYFNASGLEPA